MRSTSTLLFIGAAAAKHIAHQPSSKIGLTTIHPGSTHAPVTVTQQYQTIPTYVVSDSSSSLDTYLYVSTVIKDADNKKCTVTKTEQPVTVSHYKSTITHTTTYGAMPTGAYPFNKNGTAYPTQHTKTWEELYERIDECPYKNLGPSALPGYPGSGLCGKECYGGKEDKKDDTKYQPVKVKEYSNGKWQTFDATYTYGAPTPKATTYDKTGTYTVPAYDMTVHKTTTVPAEGKFTAPAGKTVTYGGCTTEITKPTHITTAYATCETKGTETKTVIKTTTIHADKPGTYTIVKPTVTVYPKETVCTYPTAHVYQPGVYHHSKETVTITKTKQAYTCSYHSSKTSSISPSSTPSGSAPAQTQPTASVPEASPTAAHPTSKPSDDHPTDDVPSATSPSGPDPSADMPEPEESYGHPVAGYVKRGGMLERRKVDEKKAAAPLGKRLILV